MASCSLLLAAFVVVGWSLSCEGRQLNQTVGDDVTLQCEIPRVTDVLKLVWLRPELGSEGYVFFYRNGREYKTYQHPAFHNRVRNLNINDGNFDVTLLNVTVKDSGKYECEVILSGTKRTRRAVTEVKDVIWLKVSPGETSGQREGDVNVDSEIPPKNSREHVLLIASGILVMMVVVVMFVITLRYKRENFHRPPEKTQDPELL